MSDLQIDGEKRAYNLYEEAARVQAHGLMRGYDADEWDQATTGANYSLRTNRPNLFKNVAMAHRVLIRSQKQITVKWNVSGNPAFTVDAGIPFEETGIEVTDILINSAHASNLIGVYMT